MKEKLKELWNEVRYHARSSVFFLFEAIKLKLAIALADIKQKARNRRFFVVMMTVGITKSGKEINRLRSIDNEGFRYAKRNGWLPKRMTALELEQKCFYATPISRNNTQAREDRQKAMQKYKRYQRVINDLKL